LTPATVITINGDFSAAAIQSKIQHFEATDDVFNREFLHLVIFVVGNRKKTKALTGAVSEYLRSLGTAQVGLLDHDLASERGLHDGPYLATALGLHPVWKLLPDHQGAFVASVVQTKSGE
jgi:hypothetical protein